MQLHVNTETEEDAHFSALAPANTIKLREQAPEGQLGPIGLAYITYVVFFYILEPASAVTAVCPNWPQLTEPPPPSPSFGNT